METLHTHNSTVAFFSWWGAHSRAYEILVPQTGIEPTPSAVEAYSPNHRTAKEFPSSTIFILLFDMYTFH